jgi:UDP-N-acetylmuramate--alanine ligase
MSRISVNALTGRIPAAHTYDVFSEKARQTSLTGKRFHLIGIGGIGMSGLAGVLARNDAIVSGSDQSAGATTRLLQAEGVDIQVGHSADNVNEKTDTVVISAAIKSDNPELVRARQLGCKIYKYAQLLGDLFNRYRGIAVSGTHGKSTTSAWLTYVLKQADVDVNYIVGAQTGQLQNSCGTGDSDIFVAEACEYDRSFHNLRPKIACVLNIESEHLDYYRSEAEIVDAFIEFATGIVHEGVLVANGMDDNAKQLLEQIRPDITCLTFGLDPSCDVYARNLILEDGLYGFDVYLDQRRVGSTRISLPGKHNVLNGLAVFSLALAAGVPVDAILELIPAFTGIDRRLMFKGCTDDIVVVDDYAHHPTEVRASLAALQQRYQPQRLWVVFQPHQYSRTRILLEEFSTSFTLAHETVVPDIYGVRDSNESKQAISAQVLVDRLQLKGCRAVHVNGTAAICEYLQTHVGAGDVVVTMGAGDVWKVADEYIQRLRVNR